MAKNHYFSDITELFLKAKEEENIEPSPHMKAAVREMLVYKINEMKVAPEPRENFFNKWKFQFIGVPASLFALVLIVFAATNLKFTIPKEDFTPTTEKEPAQEVEILVEPEKDRPIVKTAKKPDLLVLEFGEEGEIPTRTLKKLPVVSTRGGEPEEEPTVKTEFKPEIDKPEVTSPILVVTPESKPVTQPEYEEILPNTVVEEPTEQPVESLDQDIPTEPEEEPAEVTTEPVTTEPVTTEPVTTEPVTTEPVTEPPVTTVPLSEKTMVVDYTEKAQEFIEKVEMKEEAYEVYYYRDSKLAKEPIFDKEQIIKLTGSSAPSAVNVYYTEEKQVVVEVKENDTSKWYLFTKVNDIWTIQKYEKQTLKNVVR